MYQVVETHESMSSDEGSGRNSDFDKSKRSTKKPLVDQDINGYTSSSLQGPNNGKGKQLNIEERQLPPSSGIFGCFS